MIDNRLYTVKEISEHLQIRKETILRWIKTGRLEAVMPGGTKIGYRVPASELERLLRGER